MRTRHVVILLALVLLIAALFTFLSKRWWAKRIEAKYNTAEPLSDEFLRSHGLLAVMTLYYHGTFTEGDITGSLNEAEE